MNESERQRWSKVLTDIVKTFTLNGKTVEIDDHFVWDRTNERLLCFLMDEGIVPRNEIVGAIRSRLNELPKTALSEDDGTDPAADILRQLRGEQEVVPA